MLTRGKRDRWAVVRTDIRQMQYTPSASYARYNYRFCEGLLVAGEGGVINFCWVGEWVGEWAGIEKKIWLTGVGV